MTFHRRTTSTVAAIAVIAFMPSGAFAASPEEITAALTGLLKSGDAGIEVNFGTPAEENGALVYSNVTIVSADKADTAKIGTLSVTGGDVNAEGGLSAETIVGEGLEVTSTDGNVATVDTLTVSNLSLAKSPAEGVDPKGKVDMVSLDGITITEKDKPPVTITTASFEASDYQNDYPHTIAVNVEGVAIDPAMAGPEDPTAAQIKALGYDKLLLSLYGSGTWDEASGDLTIEEFSIEGEDMGAISFSGILQGFTPDVLKLLQEPNPSPETMTKILIKEAAISYEDASLAGRLLDQQAKDAGTDRETFVSQITAALPLMLSALQNPGFQTKVSNAATAFLKDPQNITLSVAPQEPQSLLGLTAVAQESPQTLPDLLNADVTANETE